MLVALSLLKDVLEDDFVFLDGPVTD